MIGLDYHSGGVDGGLSWYSITSVEGEEADPSSVRFTARCDNNGRPYVWWDELRPAAFETWYNLRMDFVIVSDTELRIDYFIDGRLWTTESPYEAPIILGGDYDGFRFLESWVGEEFRTGVLHVLVDNVYATYLH